MLLGMGLGVPFNTSPPAGFSIRKLADFGSSFDSWTTSVSKASDETLFVALSIEDTGTPTVSTLTFDGDAMTQDAYQNLGSTTKNRVWIYRLASSKTSGDVVLTMSETTDLSGIILAVKGITGGPTGTVQYATASNADTVSDTFVPASAGLLLNALSNGGNDMTPQPSNNGTAFARINGSSQALHVSWQLVEASSVTTGWTRESGASTSPRLVQATPVYALS